MAVDGSHLIEAVQTGKPRIRVMDLLTHHLDDGQAADARTFASERRPVAGFCSQPACGRTDSHESNVRRVRSSKAGHRPALRSELRRQVPASLVSRPANTLVITL